MQEPEPRWEHEGHEHVVHGPESSVSLRDRAMGTAGAWCVSLHSALPNGGRTSDYMSRMTLFLLTLAQQRPVDPEIAVGPAIVEVSLADQVRSFSSSTFRAEGDRERQA